MGLSNSLSFGDLSLKVKVCIQGSDNLQELLYHHFTSGIIYQQEQEETLKTLAVDVKFLGAVWERQDDI